MTRQESMLGVIWQLEMRHLLRDRRALMASLLLPLLLLPVVLWSARLAEQAGRERSLDEPLQVAFIGPAATEVQAFLPQTTEGWQTVHVDEPLKALAYGELDLVVDGRWIHPKGDVAWGAMPRIQLLFRADDQRSNEAQRTLEELFLAARVTTQSALLRERGFNLETSDVLAIAETNVATVGQVAGSRVGRWATVAILLFVLLGGSVVAGDTLAGEKERGTLETLLTSAVERQQIVAAKLLAILTFGGLVAIVQLLNLYVHLTWGMVEVPASFAVDLSPPTLVLLACLLLPLVVLIAGALLWISGRARSYKEFHFYLLPLTIVLLLPATAAALPGATLEAGWMFLPIANLSLGVRSVLVGHGAPLPLLIAWLTSAAVAWWTVRAAQTELLSEQQLFGRGSAEEVGLEPWERHVGGWFVAFWVFIFVALVQVPFLSGLITQVLLTLVVVCLGGSLGLIRFYRLAPRRVLQLRPPAAIFWLVAILGAPALMLANGALYRWTSGLFPLSRQAFEAYAAFFEQNQLSWIEMLAVAAVLPAICEEFAFRGILLSGLRRRLPELQLCLVVGLTFALFHFDLARFVPTLFLGAVLALLTLRSGSIYPAMVWHGLNNGLVLWLGSRDLSLVDLEAGWYIGGWAASALCLAWLWRQPSRSRVP